MDDPRPCTWCGSSYQPKRRDQRTCSKRCREALRNAEYRAANQERIKAYRKAEYAANADYYRAKSIAWRVANREYALKRDAEYRRTHRDEELARCAAYRAANREARRESMRRWTAENKHRKAANQARRRERIAGAQGSATIDQIAARVAYFGGRCWMCGGPYEAIDHVKPLARGGSGWPANLRPACKSCNSAKSDRWPIAA